MALAKFHSVRGKKGSTALILIKMSAFQFGATPVYVPLDAVADALGMTIEDLSVFDRSNPAPKEDPDGKFSFEIPNGFKLVESYDEETGEVVTSADGTPLRRLEY